MQEGNLMKFIFCLGLVEVASGNFIRATAVASRVTKEYILYKESYKQST